MCSVFFEAFRMRLNIIAMLLHFYCTLDYRSSLQMNRRRSAHSCTAQSASYCFLFCTLKHPDFATTVIGSQQHCTLRLLHCLICKKNYVLPDQIFAQKCHNTILFLNKCIEAQYTQLPCHTSRASLTVIYFPEVQNRQETESSLLSHLNLFRRKSLSSTRCRLRSLQSPDGPDVFCNTKMHYCRVALYSLFQCKMCSFGRTMAL